MGDRYVKTDENEKIIFLDAFDIYGLSTSQILPFDGIEMWHGHPESRFYMKWLESILKTPDDSDIGYFVEVHLKYPENIQEKQRIFHFVRKKVILKKIKPFYEKKIKPKNFTKSKKLTCDLTDEKKYLFQYRMLIFHVRHGMVILRTLKNKTELKMILRKTSLNQLLILLLVSF